MRGLILRRGCGIVRGVKRWTERSTLGSVLQVSGPKRKGQFMPEDNDVTLDRARRVAQLVNCGVDINVIDAAINRAPDGEALGMLLGFIEDILEEGFTIK